MNSFHLVLIALVFVEISNAQNPCSPTPCGANTDCTVEDGRPVCACKPTYIGNAITGCAHECEKNEDCASNLGCLNFRYKDPCRNGCGDYATCQVRDHQAICSCPDEFGGDEYTNCIPECTSQEDCPSHLSCIGRHCGNPCTEKRPCKANTDCKVEKHTVICTCKKGFVGHPLDYGCRRQ